MTGIFIIEGMTVAIPAGGLTIHADGTANLNVHVHYDVVPIWLKIAIGHDVEARRCNDAVVKAWRGVEEEKKSHAVEAEFISSMQAMVAAAQTFEALFSVLKPIVIPSDTITKWEKRRPKRYLQVSEACRLAFQLPPKGAAVFQKNLEQIYLYRDRAIHPTGTVAPAELNPVLNVGMEPRLVWFSAKNANLIVKVVCEHLVELAFKGKPANDAVERYAAYLQERFKALFPGGLPLPETHAVAETKDDTQKGASRG